MPLPNGFVSELKARLSLEDTIGQYVKLKRAGSNSVGCCPFHSEKTPSFTVFSQSDSFYCFGCGAGGDVISFVMRMENLDYMSAVETLAARAGMAIPQNDYHTEKIDKNRYYDLNKKAARFFHDLLMSREGKPGLDYLMGKRGLTLSTIKKFGLGYSGSSWDSLCGYLMREGFNKTELKNAFLVGVSQKDGRVYDYFRNRVMFPILDIQNRVIAFGGRIIGDGNPKYLNSSDTPVFKKSRNLYALNIAKDSSEDSLILCEGYMDVIALQAAGFTNAVATLGTAITEEQVRLMKRYASTVYICYDSDDAGKAATRKAIGMLDAADVKIRVLSLKGAKDPDEYIKAFGKDAFAKIISSANGHIEYVFNEVKAKYNLENPEDKLSFIKDICKILATSYSPLEREIYLGRLNEITGVDSAVLKRELERTTKATTKDANEKRINDDIKKANGFGDRVNPDKAKFTFSASKEESILGLLMLRPEYLLIPEIRKKLTDDLFLCEFNKKALTLMLKLTENNEQLEIGELSETLTTDEVGVLTKMMLARKALSDNSTTLLNDLIKNLKDETELRNERESNISINEYFEKLKKQKQGRK